MTYPEFREAIYESIQELLPDDVTTRLLEVEKLNNSLHHGILFTKDDVPFSLTIYLEPFFDAFMEGEELLKLAKELLTCFEEEIQEVPQSAFDLTDYEIAKENIFAKIIHFAENENFLKDIPFQPFLDFAIVPYFEIDSEEMFHGTVLLKKRIVQNWKVTEEELLAWALQNTKDKKLLLFRNISEVLDGYLSEEERLIYDEFPSKMYVLTNQEKHLGAVLIYYPEVLQKIYSMLCEDYYLLPCSVHEWIVVPQNSADSCNVFKSIVREINRTELMPEEVLSNQIYLYKSETQSVHIC